MDDIYREHILDHYQNPRNFGDLEGADVTVRESNASCGDLIQLALKWKMDNGKWIITDVKFKGVGCAISTAAGSLLTEKIKGKQVAELEKLTDEDMVEMMGIEISPTRMKCATLPLRALKRALAEWKMEN